MAGVYSIPSARISDLLVRTRLLAQLQLDQRDLFRVQQQLSTQQRIQLPSEDAPAALRAISLQRFIERKQQVQTNLRTNQSFLSASDSALGSISNVIAEIRGTALSVNNTTSTDTQRAAAAAEVDRVIRQLVDVGNQQFRGRQLFAGSQTDLVPFSLTGQYVSYAGNENSLRSFSDLDVLFETNLNGNQVFGALSDPVHGSVDLNPVLTAQTKLSELRSGQGIRSGSFRISDGTSSAVVDISSAHTLGDVARLIETANLGDSNLRVTITQSGLRIDIENSAPGVNLTINEVGAGTTANELGILSVAGVGSGPLQGRDLDPQLRLTTRLDDLLGSRAQARVPSAGANNDFLVEAVDNGAAYNGVRVQLVDDDMLLATPGITSGNEYAQYDASARAAQASLRFSGGANDLLIQATAAGVDFNNVRVRITATAVGAPAASYDAGTKTLLVNVEADGSSTANEVIAAIGGLTEFTATLDTSDEGSNDGSGAIAAFTNNNFASTGNSGGEAGTLYVFVRDGESNSKDVVAAINSDVAEFTARIDYRDAPLANQAGSGTVSISATGVAAGGSGINIDLESGLRIVNGGATYDVKFTDARTVEDLLNILNGSGAGLLAQINEDGNGIDIRSRISGADFSIGENGGTTATELGVRTFTGDTRLAELNRGRGVEIIDGAQFPDGNGNEFTIVRNDGVELAIDLSGALTVQDVLDRINNHVDNQDAGAVVARLAQYGNGIELIDDNASGLDIDGNPNTLHVVKSTRSRAAIDLGLIPAGSQASSPATGGAQATGTAALTNPNADIAFTARNGGTALNGARVVFANAAVGDTANLAYDGLSNTLTITVEYGVTRAQTVVDAVNGDVSGLFDAALSTDAGPNDGQGLIDAGDDGLAATLAGGTAQQLAGADANPQETAGVFNSLLRLKSALLTGDLGEISRSITSLSGDLERVSFARAEIGARQQGLDILDDRLSSEVIDLQAALSDEIDTDMTAAISELTARQASFQASLQTAASLLQMSLLNYL